MGNINVPASFPWRRRHAPMNNSLTLSTEEITESRQNMSAKASGQVGEDEAITTGVKELSMTELTDRRLRQLAGKLGPEWESLATFLGLSKAEIFKFKSDSPYNTDEQIFNMLVEWRQRNPSSPDQVKTLSKQLREIGREDLADDLLGITESEVEKNRRKFDEALSCSEHNKKKELFCETCQKLICLHCSLEDDHEHLDLAEASTKCKQILKDQLLPVFKTDLAKIDQSLLSISKAEQTLSSRLDQAQLDVQDRLAQAIEEVKADANRVSDELKQKEKHHRQTLHERKETLTQLRKRKSYAMAVTEDAMREDSNIEFLVRYPNMRANLEKRKSEKPPSESHDNLLYPMFLRSTPIGSVDFGEVVVEDRWELYLEFGKRGSGEGESFEGARGIAAAADPDEIAVADHILKRVVICNNQGQTKSTIPITTNDVAFSSNQWVCIDHNNDTVKAYCRDKQPAYEFSAVQENEICKTDTYLASVAVMPNGNIILGDIRRSVLTELNPKNGEILHIMSVKIRPIFLAALSNGRIVISGNEEEQVEIVVVCDGKAVTVTAFQPIIDGKPAQKCRGVCSNSTGIYLAVISQEPGNGHIHHYSYVGQFVSCLAQDLYNPHGITFTADGQQLAVADISSVKIYRKVSCHPA